MLLQYEQRTTTNVDGVENLDWQRENPGAEFVLYPVRRVAIQPTPICT